MRVCAGGLLIRRDAILLLKRSEDRPYYPGVWDVPGGHCESGETPAAALARELEEEIGVHVSSCEEIARVEDPLADGGIRCHFFVVTAWRGEPRIVDAEHSDLRWVTLREARTLPLAHPSYAELFRTALSHANLAECHRAG